MSKASDLVYTIPGWIGKRAVGKALSRSIIRVLANLYSPEEHIGQKSTSSCTPVKAGDTTPFKTNPSGRLRNCRTE